jgi:hypothetical protein
MLRGLALRPLWRRAVKPLIVIAALLLVLGWLLPEFIEVFKTQVV